MNTASLVTPLYQTEPDLYEYKAKVTETGTMEIKGTKLFWIRLNETIFHPHGGGQLSDKGTINGMTVEYVNKYKLDKKDPDLIEIDHCFTTDPGLKVGDEVCLKVDKENRYLNSVWHTAAHVIDYAVVHLYPNLKGYSGQCYPNSSFMKFEKVDGEWPENAVVKQKVNDTIQDVLKLPLEIIRDEEDGLRKLKIGDHPIPCGGTHIHSLDEIASITVKNVSRKKEPIMKEDSSGHIKRQKEQIMRVSFDVKIREDKNN